MNSPSTYNLFEGVPTAVLEARARQLFKERVRGGAVDEFALIKLALIRRGILNHSGNYIRD